MNEEVQKQFIKILENLVLTDNKAILAKLRRGFDDSRNIGWFYGLFPFGTYKGHEDSFCKIAYLFSIWHRSKKNLFNWNGNIGSSFRKIKNKSDSMEKRFLQLIGSRKKYLFKNLSTVVGLLASNEIPIDWVQLLNDIHYWSDRKNYVVKNWSRSFYCG